MNSVPNYRRYHEDHLKKVLADPCYKIEIEKIQGQIDNMANLNGTRKSPEQREKIITEEILAKKPIFQEMILGVKFTDETLIKTQGNSFDVTGRCIYLDDELRNKHNIRVSDAINVEIKIDYTISGLTPEQYKGAVQTGLLDAVISYTSRRIRFVEGSDCPILSLKEINENDTIKSFYYDTLFEIRVVAEMEAQMRDYGDFFSSSAALTNHIESYIWNSDPYKHRNHYMVILHLSKSLNNRIQQDGESTDEYRKRIISEVNRLIDDPECIKNLDLAYPSIPERYRKRYAGRKMAKHLKEYVVPEYNLFSDDGNNMLFKVHRDKNIIGNKIVLKKWLSEAFFLEREIYCVLDVSASSHIFPHLIPRICTSATLSATLRKKCDEIWTKWKKSPSPPNPNAIKRSEARLAMQKSSRTRRGKAIEKLLER